MKRILPPHLDLNLAHVVVAKGDLVLLGKGLGLLLPLGDVSARCAELIRRRVCVRQHVGVTWEDACMHGGKRSER